MIYHLLKNPKMFLRKLRDSGPVDSIFWCAGKEVVKQTRLMNERDIEDAFGASAFGFLGAATIFCSKGFGR